MKVHQARDLGERIADLVQAGKVDRGYALLAPLLAERTPFARLDLIGEVVGAGPLAVNKRIAERLFLRTYDLELEQAGDYNIWADRKAAWTVDEWPESVAAIYESRGEAGLRELPSVGKSIAGQIAGWLNVGIGGENRPG